MLLKFRDRTSKRTDRRAIEHVLIEEGEMLFFFSVLDTTRDETLPMYNPMIIMISVQYLDISHLKYCHNIKKSFIEIIMLLIWFWFSI
jgi:hypothetical protein